MIIFHTQKRKIYDSLCQINNWRGSKESSDERRRKCNFQFAKKSTRVLTCAKLYQRLGDIKKKHSAEYLCLYICIYLFIFTLQQSSNFVDSLIFLLTYKKFN